MLVAKFFYLMVMVLSSVVAQGYHRGEPFDLEVHSLPVRSEITGNAIRLDVEAAKAFIDLLEAAAKAGYHIQVNYGFRTNEQQIFVERWMAEKGKRHLVAPPGWSTHQRGLSVDIKGCLVFIANEKLAKNKNLHRDVKKWHRLGACYKEKGGYQCKTELYWWLKKNGPLFGFENDVPSEPWHWTFQKQVNYEVGG